MYGVNNPKHMEAGDTPGAARNRPKVIHALEKLGLHGREMKSET